MFVDMSYESWLSTLLAQNCSFFRVTAAGSGGAILGTSGRGDGEQLFGAAVNVSNCSFEETRAESGSLP